MTYIKRKGGAWTVAHMLLTSSQRQLRTVCGLKVAPSQFVQSDILGDWGLCRVCSDITLLKARTA